ncbi:MAG: hypothetical protein ACRYF4_04915 [Janthinobacterium lividum]
MNGFLLVLMGGLTSLWSGNAASQTGLLQKSFWSESAGADLHTPRTTSIAISSRRVDDAVSPVRASQLVAKMTKAMRKTTLQPVSDATTAQLSLDMIIESHEQRSQNGTYIFLLLRDRASQHLLYCGYQRVGHFYDSAALDLLNDLSRRIKAPGIQNTGDIESCAAEAKRPVDL